jgi:hypothetical protein
VPHVLFTSLQRYDLHSDEQSHLDTDFQAFYDIPSWASINMKVSILLFVIPGIVQCRNGQQPIKSVDRISQPLIGFGTWSLKESTDNTSSAVALAIEAGYRQIDCAAAYGNEKEVGKGIADGLKKSGLKREDIWVTSKLWNDQYVYATTNKSQETS